MTKEVDDLNKRLVKCGRKIKSVKKMLKQKANVIVYCRLLYSGF
jgi:hypothetical protein